MCIFLGVRIASVARFVDIYAGLSANLALFQLFTIRELIQWKNLHRCHNLVILYIHISLKLIFKFSKDRCGILTMYYLPLLRLYEDHIWQVSVWFYLFYDVFYDVFWLATVVSVIF